MASGVDIGRPTVKLQVTTNSLPHSDVHQFLTRLQYSIIVCITYNYCYYIYIYGCGLGIVKIFLKCGLTFDGGWTFLDLALILDGGSTFGNCNFSECNFFPGLDEAYTGRAAIPAIQTNLKFNCWKDILG